jgi:hypothetical protein
VPGAFGALGNDYRGDMVRFVQDAFRLPAATEQQLSRIDQTPRSLELERADRIKAQDANAAPPRPTPNQRRPSRAGVPLHTRRTRGARWASGGRHISPTPHPGQS